MSAAPDAPTSVAAPAGPASAARAGGAVTGVLALAMLVLAAIFPVDTGESAARWWTTPPAAIAGLLLLESARRAIVARSGAGAAFAMAAVTLGAAALLVTLPPARGDAPPAAGFWLAVAALALLVWVVQQRVASLSRSRLAGPLAATLFGAWVIGFWELLVTALGVPRVLLPAPSLIAAALVEHAPTLAGDFVQTVLKSVLTGWIAGSLLGFATGVAIDRAPFLQRGLLPVASMTGTVPLVGVAPIAVMWFGFDWPSKVAVIVLMTFFPMLVATRAGLAAAGRLELELMHAYAAGYRRTLLALRLPAAMPFVFGALKVNASLALIGAIVAEFFGSPTLGLGFRISTEASRMNSALVWAAIVVSAVVGSGAYALLSRLERRVNFWHPSMRS